MSKEQTLGVISDTHGLLRSEVLQAFSRVSMILHAGDIGGPDVLKTLRTLAPVVAVRGNNDNGEWANRIPEVERVQTGGISIYMLHDLKEMKVQPASDKFDVVVSGHSHRPAIDRKNDVLFLNPGSAGPRRFRLPVCVARLIIQGRSVRAELIQLTGSESR